MPEIDYTFAVKGPAPEGYPAAPVADVYAAESSAASYEARRQAFLAHVARNPAPDNLKAFYYELARVAAGCAPHLGVFDAALDYVAARKDCADFVLHAVLRLLYQFAGQVPGGQVERARETVLGFKYWPGEGGTDTMCTWTENHQILFAAGAYLAGQLYPDAVFVNSGRTGRAVMAAHAPRIRRWLDLRFRTGFSEWLSHVYYDEDVVALTSLIDFCGDGEIAQRAAMVLDVLLFDVALNSFRGVMGSTHGRSYEPGKKWLTEEPMADTSKLLFGTGLFALRENMSAPCLALSPRYRPPPVLWAVANDLTRPEMANRQRMGIRVNEAARWGIGFDDLEDGMVLLSLEAYAHPKTIALFTRMLDAYGWWENPFFEAFAARRRQLERLRRLGLLPWVARLFERDVARNTREEVNTYTYRTPDYLLSSAQDYRAGYGGDQQHVWQATLGPDAMCFTTHPAHLENGSPGYWTGSGSLPRVAQVENVVIAIYNISTRPGLYLSNRLLFTHAWLPRDHFDEVVEQAGWILARHGDGYLALRSQHPYHWQEAPGEDRGREVVVPGRRNVWICEMGRRAVDGPFAAFVERICAARVGFGRLHVDYDSPSQGRLEFDWYDAPLCQCTQLHFQEYPRYDNAYCQAPFPADVVDIACNEHGLHLDWTNGERALCSPGTPEEDRGER
ncbi:MAG: hypothetical protein PVG11_06250 [Anaerolineae bacterium]